MTYVPCSATFPNIRPIELATPAPTLDLYENEMKEHIYIFQETQLYSKLIFY